MRWHAVVLAGLLLVSGCLGGSGGPDDEGAVEPQTLEDQGDGTQAGNQTRNDTYLKNTDYNQSHVHDYWPGEATEKVLMDESVSTDTLFSVFYATFSPLFTEPQADVGIVWFSLPNGSFVPEGTGLVTVQIDATSALENGQVALSYQPADSAEYTQLDPQGAQASWEIETTPQMVDLPHAKSTRWGFILEAEGTGAVMDGEISVTITAHKTREIKQWPEHPDFWDNGTISRLHLANLNTTFDEATTPFLQFVQGEDGQEEGIHLPEGTIVPPETSVLLVEFWYELDGNAKNNANGDVTMLVKEGSSASYYRYAGWDRIRDETGHKLYALPVDGSNWDSPYADLSSWAFQIYPLFGVRDPQSGEQMMALGLAEVGSGNATLDIVAYKDVPIWLQTAMEEGDDDDDGRRAALAGPQPVALP